MITGLQLGKIDLPKVAIPCNCAIKRCKECKWWTPTPENDDDWGSGWCKWDDHCYNPLMPDAHWADVGDPRTGPDFYCKHWEKKDD